MDLPRMVGSALKRAFQTRLPRTMTGEFCSSARKPRPRVRASCVTSKKLVEAAWPQRRSGSPLPAMEAGEEFVEAGDAGEGFGVVANVSVERPGEVIAAFVVVGGVEREKSLGIADGSGAENEAGDHGESGGVGADAESEREDGNSGEGGRLGQSAERQTQVPGEVLQKVPNPYCADLFLHLLHAAEFNPCLPEGHCARQSIFHLLLRQNFHRRPEFVVQCLFDRMLAQEVPE